jgi:uncharacterized delta-60 repeat protein
MLGLGTDMAIEEDVGSLGQRLSGEGRASLTSDDANGAFAVAVLVDGRWQEIGRPAYNRAPAERELTFGDLHLPGEIRIRVTHQGNTPAYVDAVSVDGQAPRDVLGAGESRALAVRKLASRDFDLVDAQGRTLVLTFSGPPSPSAVSLVARIEPPVISETPYQFPLENLYRAMSSDSAFYSYVWDSQPGALEIDGELGDEELGAPSLSVFCEPGTGHPAGFTHGWIRNDSQNLYVALDFTPDNTMDGDKDYAKVYVNTASGLRAFKVSVVERAWGVPGFTYTERVGYQHKVYEFAIPVAEIGRPLDSGDSLEVALAAYGTVAPPPPSYPGPRDPSFSGDGIVTKDVGPDDHASDVVVQSNGKIVVGGYSGDTGDHVFALARIRANGSTDPSFGTGGVVTTAIGADAEGRALVLMQPGDAIVLAGDSEHGGDRDFTLMRSDGNGHIDPTFGVGGVVTTAIGPGDDMCHAVALQDSKLVAAGASYNGSDFDFALVRYHPDGSLDTTFGHGGIVTTPIGSRSDIGYGLAVQPDGKLVVVGYSEVNREGDFALARYESDGELDVAFGNGGVVTTSIGPSYDRAYAVALAGEKIVVAGYALVGGTGDFAVVRYNSDGSLDTTFGTGGAVTTDFGGGSNDWAYDLAIDQTQGIVVAGENAGYYFALVRYTPFGTPDVSFGQGGKINTDIGPANGMDGGHALTIQPNGRIVVAGTSAGGLGEDDFALVRYGRDLFIHKVTIPPTIPPGRTFKYRLTFANGGAGASQVRIDETVPSSVTVTSVTSSGIPITEVQAGPAYRWIVGELGYNQGGTITITARAPQTTIPGVINNVATIATPDWDSDVANNVSLASVRVVPFRTYIPVVVRGEIPTSRRILSAGPPPR